MATSWWVSRSGPFSLSTPVLPCFHCMIVGVHPLLNVSFDWIDVMLQLNFVWLQLHQLNFPPLLLWWLCWPWRALEDCCLIWPSSKRVNFPMWTIQNLYCPSDFTVGFWLVWKRSRVKWPKVENKKHSKSLYDHLVTDVEGTPTEVPFLMYPWLIAIAFCSSNFF